MSQLPWRINMSMEAWEKFWAYTELIQGEVACMGYTELDETSHEVFVSEIFLVPQQASAAEVDFLKDGLPFAIEKAIGDGRIDDLRFCIHSHGDFATNWSSTDEDMIKKIGSTGTPWFASAIFNKHGARTGRIDIFGDTPFGRTQHTLDKLEVRGERGWEYDTERIDELNQYVKPTPKKHTKPVVKLLGQVTPEKKGPEVKMGAHDSEILVNGTAIDLDELPLDAIMTLAQQFGWEWAEDATGTRYYWSTEDDGIFFEAKQFVAPGYGITEPDDDAEYEAAAAHAYTDAAI